MFHVRLKHYPFQDKIRKNAVTIHFFPLYLQKILFKLMKRILFIALVCLCTFAASAQVKKGTVLAPKLQSLYDKADQAKPVKKSKKPVIGITTTLKGNSLSVGYDCPQSVKMAGGIPYLIPSTDDPALIEEILSHLDGVLVTGGPDVDPAYYGAERHEFLGEVNDARDIFEFLLIKKAVEHKLPVFGICRGLQIINVAMGGTLYQDIPSDFPESELKHRQMDDSRMPAHIINILPNSLTAELFGTTELGVNSRHHQCIKDVAPGLRVTAWSPDGVPESLEGYPDYPIYALQSHPEIFVAKNGDMVAKRFFDLLIEKASKSKKRK